jgi:hypothetical protein
VFPVTCTAPQFAVESRPTSNPNNFTKMKPIDKALHDLKSQEVPNISVTAEKWNVHYSTLSRNWNGITLPRHHADKLHKCKLSPPQEKTLIDYINKLSL